MRACQGHAARGCGEQAEAQAEARFLPGQERPGRAGQEFPVVVPAGRSEAGQGRKGSGPVRGDCAVPHSGPGTRGLRAQREKAPAAGIL